MSTLLSKGPLPIWAYIVIICVGSILIITTTVVLARCWALRRRSKAHLDDAQPMRRVTLRRGRLVPASHYLSLTGSRFGINFDEHDASRTRSRSPFEWWNTIKDRSNSRGDDMSQLETGSMTRPRPGSTSTTGFGRKEFSGSTNTLASEKDKELAVTTEEIVPPPEPSPIMEQVAQPRNFSRSFNPSTPTSPFGKHNRALSRIEESSPHTSMISVRSLQRRSSRQSGIQVVDGNLTRLESRRSSTVAPPTYWEEEMVPEESIPEIPRPVAYRGSRASLGEQEQSPRSLSHRSSIVSRSDSVLDHADHIRRSSWTTTIHEDKTAGYWGSRTDLKPVHRTPSKGRNVLRKKSLRKAEMVSRVDG